MPTSPSAEPDRRSQAGLNGKVAIVTGGGGGIGRACAERFAADGAKVTIADLPRADEPATATGESLFVPADVSDPAQVNDLVEQTIDRFGQIDIVVTSAGILSATPGGAGQDQLLDLPLDAWRRVLDVNLTGTLLVVQAAARHMVKREAGGAIVTISSGGAVIPGPGIGSYCVSKAGVWMLTKCLAQELGPHGIRVNTVAPGLIDTGMSKAITDDAEIAGAYMAGVPLRRIGQPEDVAGVVRHLAGDDSGYVTGKIHFVDGGTFTG